MDRELILPVAHVQCLRRQRRILRKGIRCALYCIWSLIVDPPHIECDTIV
ncbi:hypothetical protein Plhal710r2_c003g0012891 [Plasmopara halstedii]